MAVARRSASVLCAVAALAIGACGKHPPMTAPLKGGDDALHGAPPRDFVRVEFASANAFYDPALYALPPALDQDRHLVVVNTWSGGAVTDLNATAIDCVHRTTADFWADGATLDPFETPSADEFNGRLVHLACDAPAKARPVHSPPVVVATADDTYRCGGNYTGWSIERANEERAKLGCPPFDPLSESQQGR